VRIPTSAQNSLYVSPTRSKQFGARRVAIGF
jgi:hypothetical protein